MPGAHVHARSTALDYTLTTYMLDYTHTHSRVTLRVVLSISRDTHSRVTLRVVLSIYKYIVTRSNIGLPLDGALALLEQTTYSHYL